MILKLPLLLKHFSIRFDVRIILVTWQINHQKKKGDEMKVKSVIGIILLGFLLSGTSQASLIGDDVINSQPEVLSFQE